MELKIKHDQAKNRFYADINGKISELKYNKVDKETLEYYRTFVPEPLRHQGIAGNIANYALGYAKSNDYHVIPSCPFVKKYLDDHPKYADVIKT